MSILWVMFKHNHLDVSTEGCEIVDEFVEGCKKKLSVHFDSVATDQLSLSFTDGRLHIRFFLLRVTSQLGYTILTNLLMVEIFFVQVFLLL
jgi:hypothetical protein